MEFRQALDWCRAQGQLIEVDVPVAGKLELAAVVDRLCKQSSEPPAVQFNRVDGSSFPVVANLFAGEQRLQRFLAAADGLGLVERCRQLPVRARSWHGFSRWLSRPEFKPEIQESLSDWQPLDDLEALPVLQMWPEDAGSYLSLVTMISRSVTGQLVNCGIYRLQVLDGRRAAVHWRPGAGAAGHFKAYQQLNRKMPVALVAGCAPSFTFASCTMLPENASEWAFFSWLHGCPQVCWKSPLYGLPLPHQCEFVMEGVIDPHQRAQEGPFANHTGFYSPSVSCPVFTLQQLLARPNALWPVTVVGPPPMENVQLALAAQPLFEMFLRHEFPVVRQVRLIAEGAFHGALIVQLCSALEPEHRQALLAHPLLCRSRCIILIDEEISPQQPEQIFWRALNQPLEQLIVQADGRLVIDATGDCGRRRVVMAEAIRQRVERRWTDYGFPPVSGE